MQPIKLGVEHGRAAPHSSPADHPDFLAFVTDADSLAALRAVLGQSIDAKLWIRQDSFDACVATLQAMRSPRAVLVDISGQDQPLSALMRLEPVIEPGTRVLVTGDVQSVAFYRTLTRNLGIKEYLPKPLDPASLVHDLLPWLTGDAPIHETVRGGTLIAVRGVSGGVGATTIAANLAWLIGIETRRHAVLLDGDLVTGSAALAANVAPSSGLLNALETPDRIDPLLIERAAQAVGDRLHVLASEEPFNERWSYHPGSARSLVQALRQRYNFVIVDLPCRICGFAAELTGLAQQTILVADLSPRGIASLDEILAQDAGNPRGAAPHIVLLRRPSQKLLRSTVDRVRDVNANTTLIDWRKTVRLSGDLGEFAAARKGPFRTAMLKLLQSVETIPEVLVR